jgi:hypothetical protein
MDDYGTDDNQTKAEKVAAYGIVVAICVIFWWGIVKFIGLL